MHGSHTVPLVVAGAGRSGTTWIGNTLAAAAGAFSIFEPLAPWGVPPPTGSGAVVGSPGNYLPADGHFPEWAQLWSNIFAGTASNAWTRQDWRYVPACFSRWKPAEKAAYRMVGLRHQLQVRCSRRPLVKAIYSNLMLPWLARVHAMQVVYIVRHPCAVVASRLRLGWPHSLENVLAQPRLMQECLAPYENVIRDATSPTEQMAVLWCVENLIPLRNWNPSWTFACYEYLTDTPVEEFDRLVHALDLPYPKAARRAAAKLSSTAGPSAGKLIPWHSHLSEAEGDRVLSICRQFDLDFYGRSFKPLRSPIESRSRVVPEVTRLQAPA